MYNLLIALGISSIAFGLGATVGWIAGVIPAALAFMITYFLLARRTGQKIQAILESGQRIAEKAQQTQPTTRQQANQQQLRLGRLLKESISQGFAYEKWQFGVSSQLHAQLGSLEYMQRNFAAARPHLVKSNRWLLRMQAWQPSTMLALIDLRSGNKADAIKGLEKVSFSGGRDPMYFAIFAQAALRTKDTSLALEIINKGVDKHKDSDLLKTLADQIRNKKRFTPEVFGQPWLQFFPEDAQKVMANQPSAPTGRAARRAKARGKDPSAGFTHPRR